MIEQFPRAVVFRPTSSSSDDEIQPKLMLMAPEGPPPKGCIAHALDQGFLMEVFDGEIRLVASGYREQLHLRFEGDDRVRIRQLLMVAVEAAIRIPEVLER